MNFSEFEVASAIVSHLSRNCNKTVVAKALPTGWVHLQVFDNIIAATLQSVLGAGGSGEWLSPPLPSDPTPHSPLPTPHLFSAQYAHARCCSLIRLASSDGLVELESFDISNSQGFFHLQKPNPVPWLNSDRSLRLNQKAELALIHQLIEAIDEVECPSKKLNDSHWGSRVLAVASAFENFWRQCRIWGEVKNETKELAQGRIGLILATQSVLKFILSEKLQILAPSEL